MVRGNQIGDSLIRCGVRFSLLRKGTLIAALLLAGRLLVAQVPSDVLVQEETDGQGFKYQVPNATLRKSRTEETRQRSSVRQVLQGSTSLTDPAIRFRFRAYFQSYLFPLMTTEEGLKTIAKDRQDFFRDLMSAKSNEAHKELIDLTLKAMQTIVQDPAYRPATRFNAMLIISNLNDVEPNNIGATQTLPEPMRAAARFILDQFQKADNPDTIKLAALMGIARNLEWENYKQPPSTPLPAALRTDMLKAVTQLAEAKEPPEGRDPAAHTWFRRRAIEALTQSCLIKPDADIATAMEKMLKDDHELLSVRCAAASALGKMSLAPPVKLDIEATAKDLGYLALLACETELAKEEADRKAEYENEARLMGTYSGEFDLEGGTGMAGSGYMPGGGGMGGTEGGSFRPAIRPTPGISGGIGGEGGYDSAGGGLQDPSTLDPKHYRTEYLRRRMRQELYAVQLGLTGGEDHSPTKSGGGSSSSSSSSTADRNGRGVFAIAKSKAEKDKVDEVYFKVRKLIEAIEIAGNDTEFLQVAKDVRKELKPLEIVVGKRVPPPGAPPVSGVPQDDLLSPSPLPGKAGPTAKAGKAGPAGKGPAKGAPAKSAPAKAAPAKGKTAVAPPRPQPHIFGRPR